MKNLLVVSFEFAVLQMLLVTFFLLVSTRIFASASNTQIEGSNIEKEHGKREDSGNDSFVMRGIRQAHPLWLRERCRENFYTDPETRQPKYNLHEEAEDISIGAVRQVNGEGFLVKFSDNKECYYPFDIIKAELLNEETFLQVEDWEIPAEFTWDAKTLVAPPIFKHDDIIVEGYEMKKFLSSLISIGIAVISEVPREEGECVRFGSRFSTMRDTEWGKNFNVRSKPDVSGSVQKKDLAYTLNPIGMHVDSPYRVDTPPAFQLLHAIDHCNGPECQVHNQFVDGFAVARALWHKDKSLFEILVKTSLRWENNGGDDSSLLFRYAPMIELEERYSLEGSRTVDDAFPYKIKRINFSAKSGGYAPNLPREQLDIFYKAKREFSFMLHHETYTVDLQLFPGALVIFDNNRLLHSRTAIAESDGERWLQGCYLNRDGIYFLHERVRRKLSNMTETPFTSLREAGKADYDRMGVEYDNEIVQNTMKNLIDLLNSQNKSFLGQPVSLYEHNIQTASRAYRNGEDDETIVVSLFHDIFETLAVKNHGDLASSMLAPWISAKSQWLLANHEVFQGYYYFHHYGLNNNLARDLYGDHPYYNWTASWCEKYDQASFDPNYPSLPISAFLPVLERVLAKPQYWWDPSHPKAGAIVTSA